VKLPRPESYAIPEWFVSTSDILDTSNKNINSETGGKGWLYHSDFFFTKAFLPRQDAQSLNVTKAKQTNTGPPLYEMDSKAPVSAHRMKSYMDEGYTLLVQHYESRSRPMYDLFKELYDSLGRLPDIYSINTRRNTQGFPLHTGL
jgi:hypothetical protein